MLQIKRKHFQGFSMAQIDIFNGTTLRNNDTTSAEDFAHN